MMVNLFIEWDLSQPESAMTAIIDNKPTIKEANPTILGKLKALLETLNGNPWLVSIRILVIAKIDIRKEAVAMTTLQNI